MCPERSPTIGHSSARFEEAAAALLSWQVHRSAGLQVRSSGTAGGVCRGAARGGGIRVSTVTSWRLLPQERLKGPLVGGQRESAAINPAGSLNGVMICTWEGMLNGLPGRAP
ncbi:DUF1990 family protein [Angustibacter sp. McL0619]|uniref:DUF1990 family protein n=1 Tax=Angustibacter sp. McL0619 TaxID=3415676 RepID=UPI003CF29606